MERAHALSGCLPSLQPSVHGPDSVDALNIGGDAFAGFAVDFICGAHRDPVQIIEDVELGHDQPIGAVDLVGVAQQGQIKPAAAPGTSGDGAVLLAAGAENVSRFVMDLAREGSFAYPGDIGLGDADDGADARGPNAGADGGSSGSGGRRSNEGVRAVVDVEHG